MANEGNDLALEQAKRLQLAREHAGYKSARMAALRLGWKYPTYSAHENGTRKLTPDVASRYSKAFNVLAEFLLFGSNPPEWYGRAEQVRETSVRLRFMRSFTSRSLARAANDDLSGRALAGRDYAIPDSDDLPPGIYAFAVDTDEMNPRAPTPGDVAIKPGDVLIAEAMPEGVSPGDVVIVYDEQNEAVGIRKVKGGLAGALHYVATNDDFMPVSDKDAIVIGKAVMHIRTL